jgi:signal transduction histidine kinase
MYTHIGGPHRRVAVGTPTIGLIAAERRPYLTNSVIGDPHVGDEEWAKREGMVAFAGYPLIAGERLLGVVATFSRKPVSAMTFEALGAVARGIALGIETRRRAAALHEALRWAKESDRLKTAFLANMSHEIRTPLNVILGYADILRSELGAEEDAVRGPLFDGIKRGSDRLLNTIHSILDVARLEAGTFRYQPRAVHLRELIEEVSEPFDALARKKGLELRLDVQEPAATVRFDPYCLSHSLRHLLDNAVKFTAAGSVTIRLHRDGDRHLVLEVQDTGAGIDEAFQSRLFETFSQEDSGYTRPFEGAGLGLALAKRFLSLGNARILVSSRKGAGTTVSIHFETASEVTH